MGLHGKANFFITETSFLMVMVTWPFFRLYLLPSKIIYSSLFEATPSSLVCNGTVGPGAEGQSHFLRCFEAMLQDSVGDNAFRLGLMALVAMHAYWYYLFLRILHKLIKGVDAHEAGADEYEGASDDESEAAKE